MNKYKVCFTLSHFLFPFISLCHLSLHIQRGSESYTMLPVYVLLQHALVLKTHITIRALQLRCLPALYVYVTPQIVLVAVHLVTVWAGERLGGVGLGLQNPLAASSKVNPESRVLRL